MILIWNNNKRFLDWDFNCDAFIMSYIFVLFKVEWWLPPYFITLGSIQVDRHKVEQFSTCSTFWGAVPHFWDAVPQSVELFHKKWNCSTLCQSFICKTGSSNFFVMILNFFSRFVRAGSRIDLLICNVFPITVHMIKLVMNQHSQFLLMDFQSIL